MSDADLVWKMVLALSVLAGIAVAVKKVFFSKFPQPFSVMETEVFMSRREATQHFAIFEARILAVERRLDKDLSEMRVEIGALHEKINHGVARAAEQHAEVMRAIGRLEGR